MGPSRIKTKTGAGWFGLCAVFVAATVALLFVFRSAQWHAEEVSLPRYCDDPLRHVEYLRETLAESPGNGQSASDANFEKDRRARLVAAKLIYLVPREEGEALEAYLDRVTMRILDACG